MRIYNVVGYTLLILHALVSAFLAPSHLGLGGGLLVGGLYLLLIWLLAGIYLPEILHMGIAHRALEFKGWFVKSTTLLCNAVAIYVNPRSWVNRHRHHHAFSDRDGDPNKLGADGFWKTLYLCLFPYRCQLRRSRSRPSSAASPSSGGSCRTGCTRSRYGAACGSSVCGRTWYRTTGPTTGDSAPDAIMMTTTP